MARNEMGLHKNIDSTTSIPIEASCSPTNHNFCLVGGLFKYSASGNYVQKVFCTKCGQEKEFKLGYYTVNT